MCRAEGFTAVALHARKERWDAGREPRLVWYGTNAAGRRVLGMASSATEPDENLDWLDTRRQSRSYGLDGTRLAPRARAGHGKGVFSRVSEWAAGPGAPGGPRTVMKRALESRLHPHDEVFNGVPGVWCTATFGRPRLFGQIAGACTSVSRTCGSDPRSAGRPPGRPTRARPSILTGFRN